MIAVISKFYAKNFMTGMTDLLIFVTLWHFNPLTASKILEFLKTI